MRYSWVKLDQFFILGGSSGGLLRRNSINFKGSRIEKSRAEQGWSGDFPGITNINLKRGSYLKLTALKNSERFWEIQRLGLVKREKQYAQPGQGPLLKKLCEPLCISYLPPAERLESPSGHLSIVSFDGTPVSSNVPSERFEGFFLTCTLVGNAIEFRRRKGAYWNRLLQASIQVNWISIFMRLLTNMGKGGLLSMQTLDYGGKRHRKRLARMSLLVLH